MFYIPGYDPMPPRRYRELYRKESQAQAEISGYSISQTKAPGPLGWNVTSQIDGQETVAEITVLYWADLVQGSMKAGIIATYGLLLRTAWIYLSTGTFRRLMRLRKGPVIAALYPIVILLLQLFLALALGAAVWRFVGFSIGWVPALILVWGVLGLFRQFDHRIFAHYLMYDYAFSSGAWGATPAVLADRMACFGDEIRDALDRDVDEVLVVGHSSGAHLAVSILADVLRRGHPNASKIAFLSLGHVVPMVSFLPCAQEIRRDLAYLSVSEEITWVDVSAPGDGCSFALCDPVAVTGVAPQGQKNPLVLSAAFTKTLRPETWQRLRWRFFRLHFQYLCAFDNPGDYDYFQITAGPVSLADRFKGRRHSNSRVSAPLSRFTDMAP